jgi:hypothetical protein
MAIYINKRILPKTKKIIFFDIDSTLSTSTDHHFFGRMKNYQDYKKSIYQDWETIRFYDFQSLSHSCIALFAGLLAQTGAKAVCVSSWNRSSKAELYVKELQQAFETMGEFPEDWLLGFSGCGGGDRYEHSMLPLIKEIKFKGEYVALDDGGFEYSNQENVIIVDGRLGFNFYDYEKALKVLKVDERVNGY